MELITETFQKKPSINILINIFHSSLFFLRKYKLNSSAHFFCLLCCVLDGVFPVSYIYPHICFSCFFLVFSLPIQIAPFSGKSSRSFSRDFSFRVPVNRFRDRNQGFNLCSIPLPFRLLVSSQKVKKKPTQAFVLSFPSGFIVRFRV